ncbi:hypothetical protein BC832DRAFT_539425 [Gaertneriomyces semiglobifer]|nr:hypothetical protein BC832DRAFT_539425 [Gaertneriomyces semiglobifer]
MSTTTASSVSTSTPTTYYLIRDGRLKQKNENVRPGDSPSAGNPIVGQMRAEARPQRTTALVYTIPADLFSLMIAVVNTSSSENELWHCSLTAQTVQQVQLPSNLNGATRRRLLSNKGLTYLSDTLFSTTNQVTAANAMNSIKIPAGEGLSTFKTASDLLDHADFLRPFHEAKRQDVVVSLGSRLRLNPTQSGLVFHDQRTGPPCLPCTPQSEHVEIAPNTEVTLQEYCTDMQQVLSCFRLHVDGAATQAASPSSGPPSPGTPASGSPSSGNVAISQAGAVGTVGPVPGTSASGSSTGSTGTCAIEVSAPTHPSPAYKTLMDILFFYEDWFEKFCPEDESGADESPSGFDMLLCRCLQLTCRAWNDLAENVSSLTVGEVLAFTLLVDFYLTTDPHRVHETEKRFMIEIFKKLHERYTTMGQDTESKGQDPEETSSSAGVITASTSVESDRADCTAGSVAVVDNLGASELPSKVSMLGDSTKQCANEVRSIEWSALEAFEANSTVLYLPLSGHNVVREDVMALVDVLKSEGMNCDGYFTDQDVSDIFADKDVEEACDPKDLDEDKIKLRLKLHDATGRGFKEGSCNLIAPDLAKKLAISSRTRAYVALKALSVPLSGERPTLDHTRRMIGFDGVEKFKMGSG